jgi:hypothetical protein
MEIPKSQCAELNLLLRQGAKMARDLTAMRKFDARFGERLGQGFTEAADDLVGRMKQASKKTLADGYNLPRSVTKRQRPPA